MLEHNNIVRRCLVSVASLAIGAGTWLPSVAMAAPGWKPQDIYATDQAAEKFQASDTMTFAQGFITTGFGIAIAVFVLKVILTAVDRLIFGGSSNSSFRLDEIPLVGAYADPERDSGGDGPSSPWTWQRIWIHFAIQITLCVSAIFITNLLISLIGTVLTESELMS